MNIKKSHTIEVDLEPCSNGKYIAKIFQYSWDIDEGFGTDSLLLATIKEDTVEKAFKKGMNVWKQIQP